MNVLWYIDAHIKTIKHESSPKAPKVFLKFQGFNRPEKSKRRKRNINNLKQKKLEKLVSELREVIQCMTFIEDGPWADIRLSTLELTTVLDEYSSYLDDQNINMKKNHLTPRSNFEKATNLTVLPENKLHVYDKLRSLNNHLKSSELFEPIAMRESTYRLVLI